VHRLGPTRRSDRYQGKYRGLSESVHSGARSATAIGLGLGAGVIAAASLPPVGLWPLGILGIAILLVVLEDESRGWRFTIGLAFGLGQFIPGLWWAQHFSLIGAIALMILEALFLAFACLAITPRRGRSLSALGALVLFEWLRSIWPFGGLPIGGLALGQVNGPLAATARLGGSLGVMAALVIAGAGLRHLLSAAATRRQGDMSAARRSVLGGAMVVFVTMLILLGLASSPGGAIVGTLRVAAVQGGGARGTSAQQTDPAGVTAAHISALTSLPDGTQLTVLPEDVVGLDRPLVGSWQLADLKGQAVAHHTFLVAGVTEPVGSTRFLNYVVGINPSGSVASRVEKVHRVPFGEYVPFRKFLSHFTNFSAVPRDAIAGSGSGVMRLGHYRLGVLISYEVFFASRSLPAIHHGAQVLVVPTNTTSYPGTQMPSVELAAARLQALSCGRDLIQASPTGYSAIISANGHVVVRSALSAHQVVSATIDLRNGSTIYDDTGDLLVLILAAIALGLGWTRALSRMKPQS